MNQSKEHHEVIIRAAALADAAELCDIYNHYVRETVVTFDLEEKTTVEFAESMGTILTKFPFLVAVSVRDSKIIGYAYASVWKVRPAYNQTVESSVYLHPDFHGLGAGTKLYAELFEILKKLEIHNIIGGVSLPNEASVRLHEKFGFKKVAEFHEVGRKFNRWVDVGYWELILE